MKRMKVASDDVAKLREEVETLKQKLSEQETLRDTMAQASQPNLSSEIRKIQAKNRGGANSINVTERNDHKNVRLWTRDGLPLGPFHPDNAIQTLNTYAANGIFLSATRPTQAQVEAYCATPEYKALQEKERQRREIKLKSRRSGNLEKLTAEIAKQTGQMAESMNRILSREEVKQR